MKQKKKRFLSGFLSAVLALTSLSDFPVDALASDTPDIPVKYTSAGDYIADHLNPAYAEQVGAVNRASNETLSTAIIGDMDDNGLGNTYHYIMLHYTLMDQSYVKPGITFEEMYNVYPESFIADYVSSEQVYLVDEGDYYVALADLGRLNGGQAPVYAQFSDGDVEYPTIYDDIIKYDYSTGIIYIPKSFYENEAGEEVLNSLAAQVLVPFSFGESIKKINVKAESFIEGVELASGESFEITASTFANTLNIPLFKSGTAVDLDKISVYLNDEALPISLDDAYIGYEGTLVVSANAVNTYSVRVEIAEKDEVVAYNPDILVACEGNISDLIIGNTHTLKAVISTVAEMKSYLIPGVKVEALPTDVGKVYHYQSFGAQNGDLSQGDVYYSTTLYNVSAATAGYNMTIDYSKADATYTDLGTAGKSVPLQTLLDQKILQSTPEGFNSWAYKLIIALPTGALGNTRWTVDMLNGVAGVQSGAKVAGYPNLSGASATGDGYFTSASALKFMDGKITNSLVAARCMDIKASSLGGSRPASVYGDKVDIYARLLYVDTETKTSIWSFVTPGGLGQGFGGIYAFSYEPSEREYYYRVGARKVESQGTKKPSAIFGAVSVASASSSALLDSVAVSATNASDALASALTSLSAVKDSVGTTAKAFLSTNGAAGFSDGWNVKTTGDIPGVAYVWVKELWVSEGHELDTGGWLYTIKPSTTNATASAITSIAYYKNNGTSYERDASKDPKQFASYGEIVNERTRLYGKFGVRKVDSVTGNGAAGIVFNVSTSSAYNASTKILDKDNNGKYSYVTSATNANGYTAATVTNILTSINGVKTIWEPVAVDGLDTYTIYVQEDKQSAESAGYDWNDMIYKVVITGSKVNVNSSTIEVTVEKLSSDASFNTGLLVGSTISTDKASGNNYFSFEHKNKPSTQQLKGYFGFYKTTYGVEDLKDIETGIEMKVNVGTGFTGNTLTGIKTSATTDAETGLAYFNLSNIGDSTHADGTWETTGTKNFDFKRFYVQEDKDYCETNHIEWSDTIYEVVVYGKEDMADSGYYMSIAYEDGSELGAADRTYAGYITGSRTGDVAIISAYDSNVTTDNYRTNINSTLDNIKSCAPTSANGTTVTYYFLRKASGFYYRVSNQIYEEYEVKKEYESEDTPPVRATLQFSLDDGTTWYDAYDANVGTAIAAYLAEQTTNVSLKSKTAVKTITSQPDVWLCASGAYPTYADALAGTNRLSDTPFRYVWTQLPAMPSFRAEQNYKIIYRAVESGFAGNTWSSSELPAAANAVAGNWKAESDFNIANLHLTNNLFGFTMSLVHTQISETVGGTTNHINTGTTAVNRLYYYASLGVAKMNPGIPSRISGSAFTVTTNEDVAINGVRGGDIGSNYLAVLTPSASATAFFDADTIKKTESTSKNKTFYIYESTAPAGYDKVSGYWIVNMTGSRNNTAAQDGVGSVINSAYFVPIDKNNGSVLAPIELSEQTDAVDAAASEKGYYANNGTLYVLWVPNTAVTAADVTKKYAEPSDQALPVQVTLQVSTDGTTWTAAASSAISSKVTNPVVWLSSNGTYLNGTDAYDKNANRITDDSFYYRWNNLPKFYADGVEYQYRAVETGIALKVTGEAAPRIVTWTAASGDATSGSRVDAYVNVSYTQAFSGNSSAITNNTNDYKGIFGIYKKDDSDTRVEGLKFNVYTDYANGDPSSPASIAYITTNADGYAALDVSALADKTHAAGHLYLTTADTKTYYVQEDKASAEGLNLEYNNTVYKVVVKGADSIADCTVTVTNAATNEPVTTDKTAINGITSAYFTQTNRRVTEAHVKKQWSDQTYVSRIKSIEVSLLKDGTAIKTATLNAANSWSADWMGLDYYAAEGKDTAAVYTVREDSITLNLAGAEKTLEADAINEYFTVSITDDDSKVNGKIITNTFYEAAGSVALTAKKTLSGRALKDSEFSFTLTNTSAPSGCTKKASQTVNNSGANVTFSPISFTKNVEVNETGVWIFTVNENVTTKGGVKIDSRTYTYTVTVSDPGNKDGKLAVSISPKAETVVFNNTYSASGSTTIEGKKLFAKALKGGEFAFKITNTKAPTGCTKFEDKTVTNAADGSYSFGTFSFSHDKDYSMLGTWEFTVTEITGTAKFVGYDSSSYKVVITVTDNEDGTLKVVRSVDGADYTSELLGFNNKYLATGSFSPSADKIYQLPFEEGAFEFAIELVSGPEGYTFTKETKKNDAKGHVAFSTINYNLDMLGTYVYKVYEIKGTNPGIYYDPTISYITVVVADNVTSYDDANAGRLSITSSIRKDSPTGTVIPGIEEVNTPITVEISKTDIVTGEYIEGAVLEIYAADKDDKTKPSGDVLYTWTSTAKPQLIKEIPIGDYVLVERSAPTEHGFVKAADVPFTVSYTNQIQKVLMEDEHTELRLTKTDYVNNEEVKDAILSLYRIVDEKEVFFASWKTGETSGESVEYDEKVCKHKPVVELENGKTYLYLEYIPVGTYVLKETVTPSGYLTAEDLVVTVTDTAGVQAADMIDYRVPEIKTTAKDLLTDSQLAAYGEKIKVTDTIDYKYLLVENTYKVEGWLVNAETYAVMKDAEGNEIKASAEFKPTSKEGGSVTLEYEIDTKDLEDTKWVFFAQVKLGDEIVLNQNNINDENETLYMPKVFTSAVDKETDSHTSVKSETSTVVDKVTYTKVIPGREYTITGVLMKLDENGQTGEPLLDKDGQKITASDTFTATTANGVRNLEFAFDSTLLDGETLVVFEDLYYNNIKIATHSDLHDENQTVHIPKISTTFTCKEDESHIVEYGEDVTVKDTVKYENLPLGTYTIKGVLMRKDTNEPLLDEQGQVITSRKTFYNESCSGEVELEFTINTKLLKVAGKEIVAFEYLYYDESEIEVSVHADITSKPQTIFVKQYGQVEVHKTDEDGEDIEGVTYIIYSDEACEIAVASITTDKDGYGRSELLPAVLYADDERIEYITYYIKEIYAPAGFELVDTVESFTFDEGEEILTKTFEKVDRIQKGKIAVAKKGLLPVSVRKLNTAYGVEVNKLVVEYRYLKGAVFTIYADEQLKEEVTKVTTSGEGIAESEYLKAGTYFVKETYAPYGFAVDETVYKVEIKGIENGPEYICGVTKDIEDRLLSTTLTIKKIGKTDKEDKEEKPLEGVIFGLFAAEDIYNITGDKVVLKNTCVALLKTDEEGKATITENLPAGKYFYRELKTANDHYVLDDTRYEFEVSYENSEDVHIEREAVNYERMVLPGVLTIKKTDQYGNVLTGAEFTITNTDTGEKYTLVIGEEGIGRLDNLPTGFYDENDIWHYYNYTFKETKGAKPVIMNGKEITPLMDEKEVPFNFANGNEIEGNIEFSAIHVNQILGIDEPVRYALGISSLVLMIFLIFKLLEDKRKKRI